MTLVFISKLSVFIVLLLTAVSNVLTCEPSEEERELSLIHSFKRQNIKDRIAWYQDNLLMSFCPVNDKCYDTFVNRSKTTLSTDKSSYVLNFTLLSVSRVDAAKWSVRTDGDAKREICHLKVFARPKNMTCKVEFRGSWLIVWCTADRVYPYGLCQHGLTLNTHTKLRLSSLNETVSTCSGSPLYCKTSCSARFLSINLTIGRYEWLVTVYPNVTGTHKDLSYGANWTRTFNIDNPEVSLIDCPDKIKQGQMVTCQCKVSTPSSIVTTTVEWFKNNSIVSLGNESAILNLNSSNVYEAMSYPNIYFTKFTCRATNILNMTGHSVTYRPVLDRSELSVLMIALALPGFVGLLVLCLVVLWKRKDILTFFNLSNRGKIQSCNKNEATSDFDIDAIEDDAVSIYQEIEQFKTTGLHPMAVC